MSRFSTWFSSNVVSNWWQDERLRAYALQITALSLFVFIIWSAADNALTQLARQNIATGFGFLGEVSGFAISQSLIEYTEESTYGRALTVGLLNTLLVSVLGIVIATILGFIIGIARLSSNRLIAGLAAVYIEIIRNLPLLLQIFFWYFAVFANMPSPRQSLSFAGDIYLNSRGIFFPLIEWPLAILWVVLVFILSVIAFFIFSRMADRHREVTGDRLPVWRWGGLILFLPALLVFWILDISPTTSFPELKGFNFEGGARVTPEFVALLLALATYTAAFIAEIVRAGIVSVKRGQIEAGLSLGLRRGMILRKIIIPQAMRVIVPPLTSQYLNLTKNSSLAVAIAYPDLVSVFAGTVLNQTGQALEIIFITMSVYLFLSLLTSWLMNQYNAYLLRRGGVAA